MELGIFALAEMTPDPATGGMISAERLLRDVIEEIELADQLGLELSGTPVAPAVLRAAGQPGGTPEQDENAAEAMRR